MGKLVIRFEGKVVGEANLKLGDTTIGRKATNDVVLEDSLVSGDHAVIKTVGMNSSIYDLDSTNGTFLENQRIKKAPLKNGDIIVIGGHSLIYRDSANLDAPNFGKKAGPAGAKRMEHNVTTEITNFAYLVAGDGRDKSKNVPLIKDVIVLDNPGKNPARISRTADGYVLEALMGPGEATLNGRPVQPGGQILENGDIVEIAGIKYQFSG
ncbi:MAG TPA: FHA domain-containing protein [Burkholderiales bacterium]|nr:FHA domain-containing protein [Burkholderiales bacterium]